LEHLVVFYNLFFEEEGVRVGGALVEFVGGVGGRGLGVGGLEFVVLGFFLDDPFLVLQIDVADPLLDPCGVVFTFRFFFGIRRGAGFLEFVVF
jgi:hypothetical protein